MSNATLTKIAHATQNPDAIEACNEPVFDFDYVHGVVCNRIADMDENEVIAVAARAGMTGDAIDSFLH